jgi:hypothetical protein
MKRLKQIARKIQRVNSTVQGYVALNLTTAWIQELMVQCRGYVALNLTTECYAQWNEETGRICRGLFEAVNPRIHLEWLSTEHKRYLVFRP